MHKKLDAFFCRRFPKIFRDRNEDPRRTCMARGFAHGDGWARILYEGCKKLELISEITGVDILALQVKEKFGTLRFYCRLTKNDDTNPLWLDVIKSVINDTEAKTRFACERCGGWGETLGPGWLSTRCIRCRKEDEASYAV